MKEIQLTRGKVALVDDEDFHRFNKFKWNASNHSRNGNNLSYAQRSIIGKDGKKYNIYLHRIILRPYNGLVIDHINGNSLDNRKCNLRECKTGENSMNMKKPATNTSGYKGVSWDKRSNKWSVKISLNNKTINIGTYKDIKDANDAYINASKKYHGKYSNNE